MASLSTAIANEKERLIREGFIDRGFASPDMNPGLPTSKVFYQASEVGDYENFGGIRVEKGDTVLLVYDTSLEGIYDPVWGKVSVGVPASATVGGSKVSLVTYLTSGVRIATLNINGESQDIYAPTGGGSNTPQVSSFFENNPLINGVSLKPQYQYLGVNKGFFFDGHSTQIGPDFEVQTVVIDNIPTRVIHSRLPIYSDSFISAGGISNAGGSSGINPLTMWRLLTNDPSLSIYDNYTKISPDHIPDIYQSKYNFTITGTNQATYDLATIGSNAALGASAYNYVTQGLYVAGTRVQNSAAKDALLGINSISNLLTPNNNDVSLIEWVANADGNGNGAWHFKGNVYADGWISAGGVSTGGGSAGLDKAAMWNQLTTNTDPTYGHTTLHKDHIPDLSTIYQPRYSFTLTGTSGNTYNLNNFLTSAVTSLGGKTGAITLAGGLSINSSNVLSSADTKYKLILNNATNGDSSGTSLGTLYAPVSGGDTNKVLIGAGGTSAPIWSVFTLTGTSGVNYALATIASNASNGNTAYGYFTNGVANSAARLSGTTAYSIWGVEYWASGVPKSVTSRPNLYIGTTQVQVSSATQNLTGIGSISASGAITLSTTKRIYFGDTSHYLELDENGFHFSHGVYSDSWISAGGISTGGGTSGIDKEAMWNQLTTNTDTTYGHAQIHRDHLTDTLADYLNITTTRAANLVLAGPTSGNAAAPTFRALVAADIPTLAISKISGLQTALDGKQPIDADLTAIAALTGPTSGQAFLKRKSDNTWVLDTNTYLTSHQTLYNLVIKNSGGTVQITYKPAVSDTYELTLTKSMVGLSNVENTKLSTWAGTANITTLGTITTGTWNGSTIGVGYGGTGKTSWTANGVLYASATNTLAQVTNVSGNNQKKFLVQTTNGSGTVAAPSWTALAKGDVGLGNVDNLAASGYFTEFANGSGDDANKVLITIGGTQKKLTVGYASSATNATNATYLSSSSYLKGSATNPVYFTGGQAAACTYSLKSTLNGGTANTLAYYSGANAVSSYTDTKGSTTKPIYLASGVPTECSTYAGGTAVTLNGTSKAASTASFYAPTSAASSEGQVLVANSNKVPSWANQNTLTAGALSTVSKKIWNVTYWDANGKPVDVTGRPNLYIGTTQIQTSSAAQALAGITTISASGLATIAGGLKLSTTKKIWFGDTYYLELVNTAASGETPVYAIKTNAGFYSDSFISAGGLSGTGGSTGIDKAAMWAQLTTNTDSTYGQAKIHPDHISVATQSVNGLMSSADKLKSDQNPGIIDLEDNGTTTAGTWLAKPKQGTLSAYADGLTVRYKITVAGANPTTLNISGLGAKTVYRVGTTKLTTHYGVGTYLLLYYSSTLGSGSWQVLNDYDADNPSFRQYISTDNVDYPILTRYKTTVISAGSYDTSYARFMTSVTINPSTGNLSATSFTENGTALSSKYLGISAAAASANKINTDAGSATNPVYFSSGVPVACTYSLSKSVPSNAVFTDANVTQTATTTSAAYELLFSATADNTTRTEGARKTSTLTYNPSTKALSTGGAVNGLTLSAQTTGFKISGGTTSKTLTVGADYTLGAACAKGVTDNSSSTAVTSSDTNLITGRTLYYAGYVKSSGVTSVATGTGLTGGTITSTGTISINSTYQTYISHGESAYNSLSSYLPLAGGTMTGRLKIKDEAIEFDNAAGTALKGILDVTDTHVLRFYDSTDWRTFLHSGNYSSYALPLDGGTMSGYITYPGWTNDLTRIDGTNRIRPFLFVDAASTGLSNIYWSGLSIETAYLGLQFAHYGGDSTSLAFRATSDTQVFGSWYGFYHSGNANNSSSAWACSTLSVNGYQESGAMISALLSGDIGLSLRRYGDNEVSIRYENGVHNYVTGLWSGKWNVRRVGSGTLLSVDSSGGLSTTGDQVISSDLALKTNLQSITLTAKQIAEAPAVSFDWKDGHGHSFGSIAQYWKPLVPEAVLGNEGNYTLAYGQLGVVLGVNNGKAIYALQKHETEQDREIRMLKDRVKELENEVKQLRG